jgi:hypothetical protein
MKSVFHICRIVATSRFCASFHSHHCHRRLALGCLCWSAHNESIFRFWVVIVRKYNVCFVLLFSVGFKRSSRKQTLPVFSESTMRLWYTEKKCVNQSRKTRWSRKQTLTPGLWHLCKDPTILPRLDVLPASSGGRNKPPVVAEDEIKERYGSPYATVPKYATISNIVVFPATMILRRYCHLPVGIPLLLTSHLLQPRLSTAPPVEPPLLLATVFPPSSDNLKS